MDQEDQRGGRSRPRPQGFGERDYQDLQDLLELLRGMGVERARRRLEAVDELLEEKRHRDWLFKSIKQVALWATAVAAGWLAIRGALSEFLKDLR